MIPSDFCPLCGNPLIAESVVDDGWVFECKEGHQIIIGDKGLEVLKIP